MRRVTDRSAAASEARKWSSSPMPTTSGLPARAPTMRPGSRVDITAIAYAPWNSATACCTARSRSPPPGPCQCACTRCAITSESVCVTNS